MFNIIKSLKQIYKIENWIIFFPIRYQRLILYIYNFLHVWRAMLVNKILKVTSKMTSCNPSSQTPYSLWDKICYCCFPWGVWNHMECIRTRHDRFGRIMWVICCHNRVWIIRWITSLKARLQLAVICKGLDQVHHHKTQWLRKHTG